MIIDQLKKDVTTFSVGRPQMKLFVSSIISDVQLRSSNNKKQISDEDCLEVIASQMRLANSNLKNAIQSLRPDDEKFSYQEQINYCKKFFPEPPAIKSEIFEFLELSIGKNITKDKIHFARMLMAVKRKLGDKFSQTHEEWVREWFEN